MKNENLDMKINSRLRRFLFLPSSFFLLPLLLLTIVGARAQGWTPLFNGTNLDGWVVMNEGKFSVTNGAIKINGGMGWLRTERVFTDFVLEAEWRGLETNYNSGFFLRAGLEGKPMPTNGWQVNLKQTDLGAWLKDKDIKLSPKPAAVPVGEWARFTMEARGTNATLWLNDQKTLDARLRRREWVHRHPGRGQANGNSQCARAGIATVWDF